MTIAYACLDGRTHDRITNDLVEIYLSNSLQHSEQHKKKQFTFRAEKQSNEVVRYAFLLLILIRFA